MKGLLALLALAIVVILALRPAKQRARRKAGPMGLPKPRRPLTANEQPMYFRLREALPDHIILAQVSFSALLWSRDQRVRNTFNRKVADFVVCDPSFRVVAVIELDDKSHEGREEYDQARDALLQGAGLRVLRYPRTPDLGHVRADILAVAVPRDDAPTPEVGGRQVREPFIGGK